ncbi:ABC transporter ATP-binding protein [Cognatiyoonia sp. IB215182]|uniref:ABC transporter ATP-binding protein n=1 Tax=Cognatiyoonia sp. IB215182 TaxID=3097353 RepID=UPI002A15BFCE|nr:ABC transporter ATP-binding protein [Cognatiyoonia sp. IB215182]MDX8355652.1 ABC transporter ATP-binding protein [Cognatiyoonia sp. IB215182]
MLFASVLALLIATAAKLAQPWPLKFVIDAVVPTASGQPAITGVDPMFLLALCAGGLLLVVFAQAGFQFLTTVGFALVGNRVLTKVRSDLFAHLQSLSIGFHTRSRAGDLTMRLISDVGMLKETLVTAAMPLAVNILIFVGMVSIMVWLDWQLALVALAPLPILFVFSRILTVRIRDISRTQRARQGQLAATSTETLAGIRSVQALGLEANNSELFGGANNEDMAAGIKAARMTAGLERSVDLLAGIGLALILWFGTLQVLAARITPGDLLIFVSYLKHTFRPVRGYAKYAARLAKALAAGERVVALMDEDDAVRDYPNAQPAPGLSGALAFEAVRFSHADRMTVFDGLTIDVPARQRVAIVGPSGAGKSSLITLLLRLHEPEEGFVKADGIDLREFTLRSLRRQIALVPQEPLLMSGSVSGNLALGLDRTPTEIELEAVLRTVGADSFIADMDGGLHAEIAERGASLSGGQRQLLSLARALLRETPILLLDEPTTALDGQSEAAVTEAIFAASKGRTTLLITHDLRLASSFDRVIVLGNGAVIQDDAPSALLTTTGWFASTHAVQNGELPRVAIG